MKIEITSNIGPSSRYFKSLTKQIEYAGIQTANQLAFAVRQEAHSDMARIFDRPKPNFTLRSMVVEKANRMKPYAWVGLRKDGGFRRSLSAHFTGGNRHFKKFEGWLRSIGALPQGMIALPSDNVSLDQYGNVPLRTIRAIMGGNWVSKIATGAMVTGAKKRRTKGVASLGYFVIPQSAEARGLSPGIYERIRVGSATSAKLMFVFGKRRDGYQRVIKLEEIANRVGVGAGAMFNANLSRALSTARF
jgi:hypothetical protein